ncbi:MAG: DUF3450 domain-containing protein [Myxococcota bacterium]|nr:DUF3450 domain-containing protein [Myxococcota bacterium]
MNCRIRRFFRPGFVLAVALSLGVTATPPRAQDDVASDSAAPEAQPDIELDEVIEVRSQGNKGAAEVQVDIDGISDETSDLLARYRTKLKQIEAIDLYNSQMEEMIGSQENELVSLRDQVDRVEEVSRSVTPLMIRMITALERFVELDVPFLAEEREERIAELNALMGRADVTTSEKFRQIMAAYQTENEYGRTIEAYRGPLVIDGRETTVDFLRFGRVALVYMALDESEAGTWSQEERKWIPVSDSFKSSIRDGLRIARKQSAPDLITLPVQAAVVAKGDG